MIKSLSHKPPSQTHKTARCAKAVVAVAMGYAVAVTASHAETKIAPIPTIAKSLNEQSPMLKGNGVKGNAVKILTWVRNLRLLSASFVQINADGTENHGRMDIVHNGTLANGNGGKMRLSYTDNPQLLIADEYWLWVYDRDLESKTAVDVKKTPLWLLVQPKSKIQNDGLGFASDGFTVVSAERIDGLHRIKFEDTKDPDAGFLILWWDENTQKPVRWHVTDSHGGLTTVLFTKFYENPTFPKGHFTIPKTEG